MPTELALQAVPEVEVTTAREISAPVQSPVVNSRTHVIRSIKPRPSAKALPGARAALHAAPSAAPATVAATAPSSEIASNSARGADSEAPTPLASAELRHQDAVMTTPHGAAVTTQGVASKPRLLSSGAACQGVLHSSALSSPTKVTLRLQVAKDGTASPTWVHADTGVKVPGLELAAQRCAQRLRFAPARAQDGSTVASSSVVKLTFSNHYTATLPRLTKPRHGAI